MVCKYSLMKIGLYQVIKRRKSHKFDFSGIKHKLFLLLLCLPLYLQNQTQEQENDKLRDFLIQFHNAENGHQKIALFDSLRPTMLEIENADTVSSLLLDIYSNSTRANDKKLVSKSMNSLVNWYYSLRQFDLILDYLNDILVYNDKIDISDSI